ncbi:rRNA 2'-O-methyltransferase fibrillarin [Drosophila grimshawi]|uniref:GH18878 n=1 Tax=Drosophila grimshawi TaxID=7222 RepID=B4JGN5_DROGR|nr:rRNA 2'-O-methyltransferase fibrillarin [Drosophila grimshawi]EDV92639.1 GH18878 [Drosophila grimshawi]
MCLVAVACADKLGYNYQPVGHSNSGLSFAPGSGAGGSLSGGSLGGYGGGSLGGGSLGGGSLGGGSLGGFGGGSLGGGSLGGGSLGGGSLGGGSLGGFGGGSLGGGSLGGGSLGGGSHGGLGGGSLGGLGGGSHGGSLDAPASYNAPAPAAELEKEFFTYTANEQDFDEPAALEKVSGSLNKALRVIFIKGPENRGLENAALALAKQAAQQETAIYVLNKQSDIGDLANKLNAVRSNNNNKPEVHFVKYRTPEDAANAQRAIQGQYDQLGGTSKSHDGGVAPSLNFASQGPVRQVNAQSPDNSYLPTSIFRRL